MAITYTWDILYIKKLESLNGFVNPIAEVGWKKSGTDENGVTGFYLGNTVFNTSDIDASKYVPFEQLTKEIVLGWVKNTVVGDYEIAVNDRIQVDLNNKKGNPTRLTPGEMPWETN